jgi:hypothetical protein
MRNYKPNEVIVDRATKLWADTLRDPKFDNGSKASDRLDMAALRTEMCMEATKGEVPTEEQLEVFRAELKKLLMTEVESHDGTFKYYDERLGTDYHPDRRLCAAADTAGISHFRFPCKTHMYLQNNFLSFSYGYGAPSEYHTILPDTGLVRRWFITKLCADDETNAALLTFACSVDVAACAPPWRFEEGE